MTHRWEGTANNTSVENVLEEIHESGKVKKNSFPPKLFKDYVTVIYENEFYIERGSVDEFLLYKDKCWRILEAIL